MDRIISIVPYFLFATGVFYIIRLKFFYILHPCKTFLPLFKRNRGNGISSARALSMALAGTLGVGNIVGVASALYLGGAGAIFWMIVSALVAMVLKYAEIVLAIKYRRLDEKGQNTGGAPYYIRAAFDNIGLKRVGSVVALIFSVLCIFNALTMGNILQVNAVAEAFESAFGTSKLVVGIALAAVCAIVMARGTTGIANFTAKLVPLMTGLFIILCLAVIFLRRERIPHVVTTVLSDAFSFDSTAGGIVGFLLSGGIRYGTMRGLLSNEAGCGTAPMAHATADTDSPAAQGVFGLVEVFVDTVVMCTLTALAILVADSGYTGFGGNAMLCAQVAFSSVLGEFAGDFLAVAVLLFGSATVLCQSHYGMTCVEYLTHRPIGRLSYYIVFCISVVFGALTTQSNVFALADTALALMIFINLTVLIIMNREVAEQTEIFIKAHSR